MKQKWLVSLIGCRMDLMQLYVVGSDDIHIKLGWTLIA